LTKSQEENKLKFQHIKGGQPYSLLVAPNNESCKEGKLKFLIITSVKDTMSTLPPAVARQLFEATVAWMNEQKQAGKVLEIYSIPGWRRSIGISEGDSAEEIARLIAGVPIGGFLDFEVYPLADFNEVMKANIEAFKRAEQRFPR